jgi:hypothetical protein
MRKWGFSNDAAEAIWAEHLGNNAFVWHRDQCPTCLQAYETRLPPHDPVWCPIGQSIADEEAATRHHIQCAVCRTAFRAWFPKEPAAWCPEGERIFKEVINDVLDRIDETENGN